LLRLGKGQHHDRQARRSDGRRTRSGGRHACRRRAGYAFRAQRIDPDRPRDVLDALLAQVLEGRKDEGEELVAVGVIAERDGARLALAIALMTSPNGEWTVLTMTAKSIRKTASTK